jgi:biotin carboxyl carrier protein
MIHAGQVLDGADATVRSGGVELGKPVFKAISGPGWLPVKGGDFKEGSAEYLFYDLSVTPVPIEQGAILASMVRSNVSDHEMVFGFADADWNMMWGVQLRWNGDGAGDELKDVLLYQRQASPVKRADLPIPAGLAASDEYSIAFGWQTDDVYVSFNGQDLGAEIGDVDGFMAMLARARYLVVGAETHDYLEPGGAYSTLGSRLVDFKLYDSFADAAPRPVISSVTHDAFSAAGYSGRLVAGDIITINLQTEPGGEASFDIGSIAGITMNEVDGAPGTYNGSYTIAPGDEVEDGLVTGHFTGSNGAEAVPVQAARTVNIDGKVYLAVISSNDLIPADEDARAGITVVAKDANDKEVKDHQLKLTMSTTDEYTGTVGGGSFEDNIGGSIDVDWGGVTDSFGEVTAQYLSGFAAKTILVSAKDMTSGDVGVGYIRSYIDGTVDVVVKKASATALSLAGSMEVKLSRDWITADGRSRSRITATVEDADGKAAAGHNVQFNLFGSNGKIRVVQGKTDSRGRAVADYIAGTVMGQVQIEVRDMTSGLSQIVSIELRPDAPAEIALGAEPGEVTAGDSTDIMAQVTDVNGNPNDDVDVLFDIIFGVGELSADSAATDEDGAASVTFTGSEPGITTIRGTVISRVPTAEEISAAEGAVFLFGLADDPDDLEVIEWLAEAGDEVIEGQELVVLEDRDDNLYTVVAPRDGVLSVLVAEEKDDVNYGDTLAYVIKIAE